MVIGKNGEGEFGKTGHAEDKRQCERKRFDFRVRKNHEEHDGGREDGKVDEDVVEDIVMYIEQSDKNVDYNNHQPDAGNKHPFFHKPKFIAQINPIRGNNKRIFL